MNWETPKTNWQAQNVPTEVDFNRIEENIGYLKDRALKSWSAGSSSGYMLFDNSILINWGRISISADGYADVTFKLSYSSTTTGLAGTVLTGAVSNSSNTAGYNHRNDFYVLGPNSKGMKIYNDGSSGEVNWLVIGIKVS